MTIIYVDDYDEVLHRGSNQSIPNVGETVTIGDNYWKVKTRSFIPEQDTVVITLTENSFGTTQTESVDTSRLNKLHNAILNTNKRIDKHVADYEQMSEQVLKIKKNINQQITNERRENDKNR